MAERAVVFFDGDCGLCDRFVRFAFHRDRDGWLAFAPLQGSTAKTLLPAEALGGDLLSTVLVRMESGEILRRSRAVAHVLGFLGPAWSVIGKLMRAVPTSLADSLYRWVARHRRVFGPPRCEVPPAAHKARFLD